MVARLIRIYPYMFFRGHMWMFLIIILCLGVTFVGLTGAAAVPSTTQDTVHLAAAIMAFLGYGLMLVLFTLLDESIGVDAPDALRTYRITLSWVLIMGGITLGITGLFSDVATAILEIILVLLAVAYTLSWLHETEFRIRSKTVAPSVVIMESSTPKVQ